MGSNQSRIQSKLDALADSNSVRMRHDVEVIKKRGGNVKAGFVPRKEVNLAEMSNGTKHEINDGRSTGQ